MAKLYNLARVTTATSGTGTITLGSAVAGYLTFALAGVANGDVVDYGIKDGSNSEIGTGTYTSSGTTLTRTVTKSTNANAAINLSGTAEVFITPRAETLNDASLLTTGTVGTARLGSGSASSSSFLRGDQTWSTALAKQADQQVFTASGTWTKPSDFGAKAYVFIQCWGAGGGGGKATAPFTTGGGGGAYKEWWVLLSSLGATETVTIGAGGALSATSTGTNGGNSTFGSWVTAYGGQGGQPLGGQSKGGGPYAAAAYNGYTDGTATAVGDALLFEGATNGGRAVWGGAGGGTGGGANAGGTSIFGGNGGAGTASTTAVAGTQPGGGGGSTGTGTAAKGGDGKIIVTVFDGA